MLSVCFWSIEAWCRIISFSLFEEIVELYFLLSQNDYLSSWTEFQSSFFEFVHSVCLVVCSWRRIVTTARWSKIGFLSEAKTCWSLTFRVRDYVHRILRTEVTRAYFDRTEGNLSALGNEKRNFAFELLVGERKICSAVETVTDISIVIV